MYEIVGDWEIGSTGPGHPDHRPTKDLGRWCAPHTPRAAPRDAPAACPPTRLTCTPGRRGRGEYVLGREARRGGYGAGTGRGGQPPLLLLLPQPLWLRPTRRIRTASPRRAPPVGLGLGDECEMRVARWGRVRAGRPSTEASERDGGGRRASRWRPGDPAMRLRRRVDMVTAGEQGAWRNRHRLPGGGCRLGLRRCEKEMSQAIAALSTLKALPLAQTRR